jgi:hypothetical protein
MNLPGGTPCETIDGRPGTCTVGGVCIATP